MDSNVTVDPFLTLKKAGALASQCETTLRAAAARGDLTLIKVGSRTFIRASDLQRYLDRLAAKAQGPEMPASLQSDAAVKKRRAYWDRRRRESAARSAA